VVDRGRRRSTVDRGQGLGGGWPENGRNGAPVRGTLPRLRKKEEGTAASLTSCKRGRRRKLSVRAVLGHGEKRRELGALPFIPAGEGHAGARRGETAGGNGLNAIDGWWLNEGLRGG
jgi:hypothetical protein